MDIRLDFISNIDANYINQMTSIREKYIALDQELNGISFNADPATARARALAKTNLEISLQYAIKTLCLAGEIKS